MNPDTFIGVDVSKGWLDYAITDKRRKSMLRLKTDNNLAGFKELVKKMRAAGYVLGKKALVTMENTGPYQKKFVDYLVKKKCMICVDNPLRIKKSMGMERGKNDAIDAERILDYSIRHKDKLKLWTQPRDIINLLGDLLTNRERLIRYLRGMETALSEIKKKYRPRDWQMLKRMNEDGLNGISNSRIEIDSQIDRLVDSDEAISRNCSLLMSVPGIGRVTAIHLICKTNEFTRYRTGKELACFAGVVPFSYQSGSSLESKGHVSFYANKELKKLLHIGAMSSIRREKGEYRVYYDRKVAEGKPKMLVLNNIRNKILLRAASIIKKGTPYIDFKEYANRSNT